MIAKKSKTAEEIKNSKIEYLTVGKLLAYIKENNISNDALVLIQRIEDIYFEENGWSTVKKEGFMYNSEKEIIDKAKSGVYSDKSKYSNMTDEILKSIIESEDTLDECKEEYITVFSPVKYKNDDNLYLDAHY